MKPTDEDPEQEKEVYFEVKKKSSVVSFLETFLRWFTWWHLICSNIHQELSDRYLPVPPPVTSLWSHASSSADWSHAPAAPVQTAQLAQTEDQEAAVLQVYPEVWRSTGLPEGLRVYRSTWRFEGLQVYLEI